MRSYASNMKFLFVRKLYTFAGSAAFSDAEFFAENFETMEIISVREETELNASQNSTISVKVKVDLETVFHTGKRCYL